MKTTQAATLLLAGLATLGATTEAHANADFNFDNVGSGGGKIDQGNGNQGKGNNGNNTGNPGNVNSNATVLQSPNANSNSSGSFVNLGGLNANFGDFGSSSVRIGAAVCPKAAISFIGSGSGVFQDGNGGDFDADAYSASVAGVVNIPLTGRDGKRCSEYLALQTEDFRNGMDFKATRACIQFVQAGMYYFEPTLYGERQSAICNGIAMQLRKPQEVQVKEVIKEVIKEVPVPVQVPVTPTLPPDANKFGNLPDRNEIRPLRPLQPVASTSQIHQGQVYTTASALLY